MHYSPRVYQDLIIRFGLAHERGNIFSGMGTGKTSASIMLYNTLRAFGESRRALILAPKRVAKSTWPDEITKWYETFGHLRIGAAIGTAEQRKKVVMSEPDILTINYENIEWLIDGYGEHWPFDVVFADECFVAGTQISTPNGPVPIERVSVGDMVSTRAGPRKVNHVFEKQSKSLVQVQLVNGTRFVCTPCHPVWTDIGWKAAGELRPSDFLYSEVSHMRQAVCNLPLEGAEPQAGQVLPPRLRDAQPHHETVSAGEGSTRRKTGCSRSRERRVERRSSDARDNKAEAQRGAERAAACPRREERWERARDDSRRGTADASSGPRLDLEHGDQDARHFSGECSASLQARLRMARCEDMSRGGWENALVGQDKDCRRQEDCHFERVRVEGVSRIELGSPERVWDLEVDDIHEYIANGIRVHNCTRIKSLRVTERVSVKDNKYIQGQGGTRARALADVAFKRVRRWYNLTGSPAPNGLQDLWGINWFVDGGYRLGRSFGAFEEAFFRSYKNEDGYSKLEPHVWAEAQIQNLMRDCCITIDAKDYFDIKAPIESNVYIDLPPKARSVYDRMEKDFFTEIQTKGLDTAAINAFNGSSKSTKLLQLAHGAVWHGEGVEKDWDEVHTEKIDALSSVLEEANGESVLIRYTYRPDLHRIIKAFGKGRKPVKYLDENPQTIRDWNEGRIHLVTHAKSAGHGLNLQDGGRIMCDFGNDFNLEEDEQILERIGPTRQLQSGYDRAVYRRRIVARDTIEEMSVLPVIHRKMTVQESFKNAMKVRNST